MDETIEPDAGDDLPLDFLTYLERRLGLGRDAVLEMGGKWLLTYEPVHRRAQIGLPAGESVRAARARQAQPLVPPEKAASAA